jgi:GNAT superfamily N-acetyltransferase
VIGRAREILRDDGLLALCFRILGETVYRRVLITGSDLTSPLNRPDDRCRWLKREEAADYARCHPALGEDEIRRRLSEGQRCFALWSSDREIASGVWVALGCARIDYLQTDLPLDPDEAYLFQSYTPPAHRGRGFSTAVLLAVRHALRQEGYLRTTGCIQPDRSIVYPPLFRSGSTPKGYLGWVRLGAWRWTFRRSTDRFPFYAPRPELGGRENG